MNLGFIISLKGHVGRLGHFTDIVFQAHDPTLHDEEPVSGVIEVDIEETNASIRGQTVHDQSTLDLPGQGSDPGTTDFFRNGLDGHRETLFF